MACTINSVRASNGENSMLFEKLKSEIGEAAALKTWVATQTPTFNSEFGKSKVKDSNGEPVLLYRGDRKGVQKYKYKDGGRAAKLGGGIYFTSDRAYAEKYGDVVPVFINSENIQIYKNTAEFMKAVADRFNIQTVPTVEQRRQFVAELHAKGIDVALDGFKEITIHSETQYRVALDMKSEKDIMHPIRQKASKDRALDLEKRLISFLSPFGVTVEVMESLKERLGIDAAGAADFANRLILISQGKATLDTLPEEAGHFIYELLGEKNPLVQRMRELAVKTDLYKEVKKKYAKKYGNDENKYIRETVGKLIGKAIVQGYVNESNSNSIMNTIKRILERLKQLFRNADTNALYREVESVYGTVASQVLTGNIENMSSKNLEVVDDILYSLEEEEETSDTDTGEVVKTLRNAESLINQAKNIIAQKIDLINRTTSEENKKAENVRKNLEYLENLLNSEDQKEAIIMFLSKAQKDMLSVNAKFRTMVETGVYTADEVLRYSHYVEAYKPEFIQQLLEEVAGTEEFDKLIPAEKRAMFKQSFFSLHSEIQNNYKKLGIPLLAKRLSALNTNTEMDEGDVKTLLLIGERDIYAFQRWMEVLAESPDTIIALAAKMVNQQKEYARLETVEFENELADKIDEFEKHQASKGISTGNPAKLWDMFYQKENGKNTGKLINKREAIEKFGEDSKDMEFYTYFTKKYYEMQKKLPVQYNKHLWLPSIRQTSEEKVAMGMNPLKAVREELSDTFTLQVDDSGFGNVLERSSNKYVPILYHAPIGESEGQLSADLVSYDFGNSLKLFGSMAINNQQMNNIVAELELLKEILAEREVNLNSGRKTILDKIKKYGTDSERAQKVKGRETEIYKQFVKYIDMVVYGQIKDSTKAITILGKEIPLTKLADAINKYSSFRTLALNLFSGVSNITMGKTMNFIEAHAGEYFTKKDYLLADKDYMSESLGFISDVNKKRPESFGGQLVQLFDALQEYDEYGTPVKGNRLWKRMLGTDAAFFMQKGGEHHLQVTLMYAFLRGQKIKDKNGNTISLLDAFEQKDGKLVTKDGIDLSTEDIAMYSQKLKAISQKLHGVYNNQDLINAQHVWSGRMAILFRKWLYPSYKRRYGDKRYNQRLQEWEEGNYRTAAKFFMNVFKTMKATELGLIASYKKTKKDLKSFERANMRRTKAEILTTLAVMSLIALIAGLDDDDEERGWFENMALFQLHRLNSEIVMYINPIEGMKILKSPAASMSSIETIIKLVIDVFDIGRGLTFGDGIPRYERDTGLYDEGDPKIYKHLEELIPMWKEARAATAPENRLKYMLWK